MTPSCGLEFRTKTGSNPDGVNHVFALTMSKGRKFDETNHCRGIATQPKDTQPGFLTPEPHFS